ncbi:MAG: hypothetical protein FWG99_11385 [Treponema sp.]|nr:hypothetical protein [Treponema sp.]
MKNPSKPFRIFIFLFSFLAFTFIGCDLFSGDTDNDLLKKIDAEIAWANAEKLTETRLGADPLWLNSSNPPVGRITTIDIRKGFPFTVECEPAANYGFEEWLAFYTDVYDTLDKTLSANAVRSHALNGAGVDIEESDNGLRATVTIHTSERPVSIVPWCSPRPRLDRNTNPPVNPIQAVYPYDQVIMLWFNMPIKEESVADNIRVEGRHTTGDQQLAGDDGDITSWFRIEIPAGYDNRVNLVPIDNDDIYAARLALLGITVYVGGGIESTSGYVMDETMVISYTTGTGRTQRAYRPGVVEAGRNEQDADENWRIAYFQDSSTQWNNPEIDRRFNPDNPGEKLDTVQLRFSVIPPQDSVNTTPNRITVKELLSYNLRGTIQPSSPENEKEKTYTYTANTAEIALVDDVFTINHDLLTEKSGIVQLLVLPWYYDADNGVPALDEGNALAEGHYVTIVVDMAAPDLLPADMRASMDSQTATGDGNLYIYESGETASLTLAGLSDIADNGSDYGGIPASRAWTLPWTMDDAAALFWYAKIEKVGEDDVKFSGGPLAVYKDGSLNNAWGPITPSDELTAGEQYAVYVKYEDSLGNVSGWIETGLSVMYSTEERLPVENLRAECDEDGGTITVTWDTPELMTGAYVYIDGMRAGTITGTGTNKEHSFSVSPISKDNVRAGTAVGNVIRRDIRVVAYNSLGSEAPEKELSIWNIPGMYINQSNTVEVNSQASLTAAIADTAKTNIVLTGGFTLGSTPNPTWTPRDLTNRNFYGNGHTVTITGFDTSDTTRTHYGLFGLVSGTSTNPAIIRDLTLVYANDSALSITVTAVTNIGGIVGSVSSTTNKTQILNCIVRGVDRTSVLRVNATSGSSELRLGGIAGYFEGSGKIENCRAALSVDYTSNAHTGLLKIGAVAGETGTGTNEDDGYRIYTGLTVDPSADPPITADKVNPYLTGILIANVYVPANVNAEKNGVAGYMYVGGVVGSSGENTIRNIEYAGKIEFIRKNGEFLIHCGGITGNSGHTNITDCLFTGTINPSDGYQTDPITGATNIGGIVGQSYMPSDTSITSNCYINNCLVQGNIELECSRQIYIGGILGSSSCTPERMMNITNCFFEGNITVSGSYGVFAGGFSGRFDGTHTINNCGVLAGTLDANISSGLVCVGGFTSDFGGILSRCFSRIDIITVSAGDSYIGGLLGNLTTGNIPSVISNCYATGNIRSVQNGIATTFGVHVGGLIGRKYRGRLLNSYALGNVLADKQGGTGDLNAGGLVGTNTENDIINCFSTGKVIAQSDSGNAYAGGIAGYRQNGTISNSAALGSSVTVKSASTWGVGRIYGYPATDVGIGNRAKQSMRVEISDNYNEANPPAMVFESIPPTMTGIPFIQGDINNAVIGGLFVSDLGGSGLADASLDSSAMTDFGAGSGGIWNGSGITGIDLSGFSTLGDSYDFEITLTDNAGNSADYRITVSRSSNPPVTTPVTPVSVTNFSVFGPTQQGSPTIVQYSAAGPHGETVAASTFDLPGIWTDTAPGGLGFVEKTFTSPTGEWNFNRVGIDGHPRLAWE